MRTLWLFDFDGTLSPIVDDRFKARMDGSCEEMLKQLVQREKDVVAVISSRTIEDIAARVPVPGVFVGGGSGVVWRRGDREWPPQAHLVHELEEMRSVLLPHVHEIARKTHGIDLEDKGWSLALHTRHVQRRAAEALFSSLKSLRVPFEAAIYKGPASIEVQFLADVNKAFGVRMLCQHVGIRTADRIFYAGDDENDLVAMTLVRHLGGHIVSLGPAPLIPGAPWLREPGELATYVMNRASAGDHPRGGTSSSDANSRS